MTTFAGVISGNPNFIFTIGDKNYPDGAENDDWLTGAVSYFNEKAALSLG